MTTWVPDPTPSLELMKAIAARAVVMSSDCCLTDGADAEALARRDPSTRPRRRTTAARCRGESCFATADTQVNACVAEGSPRGPPGACTPGTGPSARAKACREAVTPGGF